MKKASEPVRADPVDAAIVARLTDVNDVESSLRIYRSMYDRFSKSWTKPKGLKGEQIHWLFHLLEFGLMDLWNDMETCKQYWRHGEGATIFAPRAPQDADFTKA